MKKVIIIDDEMLARSVVMEYLSEHKDLEVLASCADGFEGFKAIQEYQPDLVFLDVQMPRITGFELLELLDKPPAIIFTTAFDAYAIKAFEANAIDYLLKPFSQERFDKALEKWRSLPSHVPAGVQPAPETPAQHDRIVVKQGSRIKIIPIGEVQLIESADDYVKVTTAEGHFLKHKTMGYYEETLAPFQFVRVHRGFLVPVKNITRIDPYEKDSYLALLTSGQKVPVSRGGYAKLRQVLDL